MRTSIFKYNRITIISVFLVLGYLLVPGRASAGENSPLKLGNGLEISLYTPEAVLAMSAKDAAGHLILGLPDGISYRLIQGVEDPEIVNKGDGYFHPADPAFVLDALASVDVSGRNIRMPVSVYVLPLPRSGLLASSSCGNDIFIAPGVWEMGRSTVACIVTHELGHVFQCRYAPEGSLGAWPEYLKIRGLENRTVYSADACHMNRPVEIFAEDFRYLFGGSDACRSGTIENPDIPLPDKVGGLKAFFVALLSPAGPAAPIALSNYPNPFNPSTTIRVVFNEPRHGTARDVDISIYRIDGSLVRDLFRGSVTQDVFSMTWDGRDDRGSAASSGVYFYAARSAGRTVTGKMLLLR